MSRIFAKTYKLLMAVFQDIVIHIHITKNLNMNCEEYLRFSLYSYKPNEYMDIVFRHQDAPKYVLELYEMIDRYNKISLSDDKLQYIIQGPCLETREIFKISSMFVNDYHSVLTRKYEFVYDLDIALELAEKWLKPIYEGLRRA